MNPRIRLSKATLASPYMYSFLYISKILLKLCFLHCAVDEMQGGVQPIEGDDVPDRWIDI